MLLVRLHLLVQEPELLLELVPQRVLALLLVPLQEPELLQVLQLELQPQRELLLRVRLGPLPRHCNWRKVPYILWSMVNNLFRCNIVSHIGISSKSPTVQRPYMIQCHYYASSRTCTSLST